MADPPMSHWEADPYSLYSYLILDANVPYVHYLSVNIQGNEMFTGEEAFCYVPSFSFFRSEDNTELVFNVGDHHEHLHLVFRQAEPVDLEGSGLPTECECEDVLGGRASVVRRQRSRSGSSEMAD